MRKMTFQIPGPMGKHIGPPGSKQIETHKNHLKVLQVFSLMQKISLISDERVKSY